ncbi:MAG: hypothetical protein AAFX54_08525 [Pseudomonadota bacterium]
MTSVHAIMVVIIRLWAAGAVITSLSSLPSAAIFAFDNADTVERYSAAYFGGLIIWIIIGVIAWFVAPWLARRVHPADANSEITSSVDAESLVAIGSFLIGVFYLAQYGIPLLVDWGSWLAKRMGETPIEVWPIDRFQQNTGKHYWSNLISEILIVIAACVMTFRPSYLARLFGWLQSTGHYKDADGQS